MTRLLEYQGKALLSQQQITVPPSAVAHSVAEAVAAAAGIGYPVVAKAQIYAGKRGKSGGIRAAENEQELADAAGQLLGSSIRGFAVQTLLIEKKVAVEKEIYLAVTSDPGTRTPVVIACLAGGMEIEEAVKEHPELLLKWPVDILRGIHNYDALNLLSGAAGLDGRQKLQVAQVITRLYEVYRRYDCKLAEINPLVLTSGGAFALDARIDVDGDALGRQKQLSLDAAEEAGDRDSTLLEQIAATIDEDDHRGTVHFIQIDPTLEYVRSQGKVPIGFDCVGAGECLTMMDELVPQSFYPVNFCDSSGNPIASKLYRITKLIFSQPGIEGYVFVSCVSSQQLDNTARGLIKALKELYPATGGQPNIPTVIAFRGAWDEDALKLMERHGIAGGRWVRLFGRTAAEFEIARELAHLHREWATEREVVTA